MAQLEQYIKVQSQRITIGKGLEVPYKLLSILIAPPMARYAWHPGGKPHQQWDAPEPKPQQFQQFQQGGSTKTGQ
jgi:hypothetical protein